MKLTRLVATGSFALVPLLVTTSLSGQPPKKGGNLEQEVRKIDQAEAAAMLANDVPAIEKLWADDLTVNAPNNQVLNGKKDAIKLVKDGILDYASFERSVEAVLVHGDTVIIMGEETVKPKGKATFAGQTLRRRITNIWMKRDGQWQLTARQATIISAIANPLEKANGRVIEIDAKPEAVKLDTARTAVLVVDMQNDFGAKGGMFDRAGIDISGIQKAVGPTAKVLAAARKAGVKIVYLKMGFKPDLSDLGASDSVNRVQHLRIGVGEKVAAPDGKESRILIRDTWNTDIVPELKPEAGDDVVYKTRFSGFYETDLDARLKKVGIKYLIVTGCTTSVCVDSTVRDAMFRDYRCVVLADCAGEPIGQKLPRSNHEASLLTFEAVLGWVSDSDRLLKAIRP